MLQILLLVFIAVPVIEIAVLLQVGSLVGGLNTLLLIIATAVIGAVLVKQQGMQNWMTMQQKMARGEMPGIEMAGGLLIFVAGIMLITPGFVTDLIGLAFLLPPSRHAIAKQMLKRMVVRGQTQHTQFHFRQGGFGRSQNTTRDEHGTVIDGEYSRKQEGQSQLDDNGSGEGDSSARDPEQKN